MNCPHLSCLDVVTERFTAPSRSLAGARARLLLISEAASPVAGDDYYAGEGALFAKTTLEAFGDAGYAVPSIDALLEAGVYLTTAVKCAKTGYAIGLPTIKACSILLEQELAQFPNLKALLLMGDVAIRAINEIARRQGEPRVIPAGSTYKIRGGEFFYRGMRAFPSYLQAGPSFYIEKVKRKTIAEDIAAAMRWAQVHMV